MGWKDDFVNQTQQMTKDVLANKPQDYSTDKVNPLLSRQLYETYYGIYGEEGRAQQAVNEALKYLDQNPNALSTLNQGTLKISDYLKQGLDKGMPYKDQFMQQSLKNIGKATDKALTRTDENLAASGMNRTGIGAVLKNDIYEKEAGAIADAQTDLNKQEIDWTEGAIAKLLGIEGLRQSALQADRNYDLNLFNQLEGRRQYDSESNARNEIDWGQILGPVASFGGMLLGTNIPDWLSGLASGAATAQRAIPDNR